jgi:hypothetical protein
VPENPLYFSFNMSRNCSPEQRFRLTCFRHVEEESLFQLPLDAAQAGGVTHTFTDHSLSRSAI